MLTKKDVVRQEKYLKLNTDGEYVIDCDEKLTVIDFHTHMSNVLPLKKVDPNKKGNKITYKALPGPEKIDLSIPYWEKVNPEEQKKGLKSLIQFSMAGYSIFKDMCNGGTYENCFKSQKENMIAKNVVLPISTKRHDCSMEAFKLEKEYPDNFIAFCSVHPLDKKMKEKIIYYKDIGFRGLKLKVTDMELKNDFQPLLKLMKICHEEGLPVLFHTGAVNNIKKENCSTTMWKILQSTRVEIFGHLLKKMPSDFSFIFGHSGIQEYKEVAEYLKVFPMCYAELSSQSSGSIKYLINEVGSQRLLFGSDWPALPQALTLSRVLSATEGDSACRDSILYKNAERILLCKTKY
ncbi:MAG: amidohydrolase family protein [Spirochaetales bacterium]|nr:amidohydrolase family protein [Spirochaetales bacterium]